MSRKEPPIFVFPLLIVLSVAATLPDGPFYFVDFSGEAGLKIPIVYGNGKTQRYILETTGTGVAIFDFDNDGKPDVFLVNGSDRIPPSSDSATSRLYRNLGEGRFEDITAASRLAHSGWGQAACVGDYDNDGWTDLCVTYYGKIVLYRNNGGRTLDDVSEKARIGGAGRWNTGCTFLDYDGDGYLDLFVANYIDYGDAVRYDPGSGPNCIWKGVPVVCGPTGLKHASNLLFRNNGNGTFNDVSVSSKITDAEGFYSFMPVTLDFDEDGATDLYVGCDSTPNILYRNNRDGTFTDVGLISGAALSGEGREQAGMGVAVGDYDLDGHLDILVTNFSDDTPTLYRNNGDSTFTDVTYQAKLGLVTDYVGWGVGLVDLDNDGWKDIFMVNGHVYPEVDRHSFGISYRQPRLIYRNLGDGTFQNLSAQAGAAIAATNASRGAAFEDLDGDGDLDVLVVNLNGVPSLLRNETGQKNHWLIVQLEGTRSNRSAIGARVQVTAGGRTQTDEVRSASSYYSSNGLRLHFGLGKAARAERVRVRWPSGTQQSFENVEAGRVVLVNETKGMR